MVTDTGDSPKEVVCVPHNSFASYFSSLLHFLTLQSPADLSPNPFPLPLQSMASHNHLDDDDDFGGDFPGPQTTRRSGSKRNFGDLEDDEDDFFGSKKANTAVEETAPGVATGMILALRERRNLKLLKLRFKSGIPLFRMSPLYLWGLLLLEKAKKKEGAFIVTFAKREQEIAELKSAVRDLKSQLKPPSMQARRLLLDPAIHEEFTRLKNLVEEKDKKVKELQDNIAAVQFTPQSKMGKMLMAKCRTLQEENEEIGNQAAEGKMHELAMKLALQKSQNAELRSQFEGLYTQMDGLSNDVERSNEMFRLIRFSWQVVVLEEKLEEKDVEIQRLKQELLLQQKSSIEEKTTDSPTSNKKTSTEMSPGQDDN
ncbi:hypothetical protein CsatA_002122 [Cannabis sativa]